MKRLGLLILVTLVACSTQHGSQPNEQQKQVAEKHEHPDPGPLPQAIKDMQSLAGEWEAKTKDHDGKPQTMRLTYEVSGGSRVIMERIFKGTPMEMLSVYFPDGKDVRMTHYCSIGNQPQLKLTKLEGNTTYYTFDGATGMKSPTEMHIHDLKMVRIDDDTLIQEWTAFQDGKPAHTEAITFHRIK